ncbi:MAG: hydrogenase maturation nickel metallochaperone HypA [Myxococcales bacterium]|nr:hydrogenase maturation nickel metallochaperone HypA [Myxococcales bacterium]
MHEVSLAHSLFDQTDRARGAHAASTVCMLRVRVGERSGVEADLFATAFDAIKDERGYPAATLQIVSVPGRDLILERIELEVPDV